MTHCDDYTKAADEILKELTLAEKAAMVSGEDAWHTQSVERLGVHSVMMTDGPNGLRMEVDDDSLVLQKSETATCFPTSAALACSFNTQLLYTVGHAIADEAKSCGVSAVLGPGLNIKRNPLCGRNFEYYSEDPLLSGELAAAFVTGMQENEVASCIKHFCLNNQETNRFVQDSCADMQTIRELYIAGFERAVKKAKPEMLMTCYNKVNGKYIETDSHYVDRLLRTEWGFNGMVVTDWTATTDRVAEIRAGCDLEMPGKCSGNTEIILEAVKDGRLKEWELDNCVRRVLSFAIKHSRAVKQPPQDLFKLNHTKARAAAAASCVLLKNEDRLLPLDLNRRIGVVGLMAKKPRWQGSGSSKVNAFQIDTLAGEFDRRGVRYSYADGYTESGDTNETLLACAAELASNCDVVVAVIGLPECCESEGFDREHMKLPQGMLKLVAQLSANCENVVVVLQLGAPVELPFRDSVKGILCAYLGGQASGSGLADVLTGRVNPSGRLAETWPVKYSDVPNADTFAQKRKLVEYREGIYSGYRYFDALQKPVAFAFGAGITYSSFKPEKPVFDKTELSEGDNTVLRVDVKNISPIAGEETLLVFAAPRGTPYRRLIAFAKQPLMPSEQKTVELNIYARDLMNFDTVSERFVLQSGQWDITVSGSNASVCCSIATKGVENELPRAIPPCESMKTPSSVFYSALGYIPVEPEVKPYTMNSTVGELRKTLVGKLLFGIVMSTLGSGMDAADSESRAMVERSMNETPLRSLCAFSKGQLPRNVCLGLLAMANHKPGQAAKHFVSGKKK